MSVSLEYPPQPERTRVGIERRFGRRLVTLVYVATLVAASIWLCGAKVGLVVVMMVLLFWGVVFRSQSLWDGIAQATMALIVVGLIGLFLWSLLPVSGAAREAPRRMSCSNNLKQLVLALHNYHDVHRTFPPAYVADKDGTPMHSWRVLLLPYVEDQPRYDAYDFSQPWNSPHNSQLLTPMPPVYGCPVQQDVSNPTMTTTSYVAVVGANTAWPGPVGRRISEFSDGTSNTGIILEVANSGIPWMQPDDVTLDEACRLATADDDAVRCHRSPSLFAMFERCRNVATADGAVYGITDGSMGSAEWAQFLTVNDGVPKWRERHEGAKDVTVAQLESLVRFVAWLTVAMFPLGWALGRFRR